MRDFEVAPLFAYMFLTVISVIAAALLVWFVVTNMKVVLIWTAFAALLFTLYILVWDGK